MTKEKVLFLCTGNSARSQMAEAYLRKYAGDQYDVYSAGLQPKGINPLTIKVMNEVGIDISTYKSKGINNYLGKILFQYLITLCDDAEKNCPTVWPGVNVRLHWAFEDPAAVEGKENEKVQKFRLVRDQIEEKIKEWITK
jgi:arsenate reductase